MLIKNNDEAFWAMEEISKELTNAVRAKDLNSTRRILERLMYINWHFNKPVWPKDEQSGMRIVPDDVRGQNGQQKSKNYFLYVLTREGKEL